MAKKYKPGDKIICITENGSSSRYFQEGKIYTVIESGAYQDPDTYGIEECKDLQFGWSKIFIEDQSYFQLFNINWKKRIQD